MPAQKKTGAKKTAAKKSMKGGSAARKTTAPGSSARKASGRKTGAAKSARKMPSFAKSPPELVAAFEQVLAGLPMAEPRKMFGYPAAFVNGHLFASLFGDSFILRLPEAEREAFIRQQGSRLFEPMPGRPMREYVVVPPSLLASGRALDDWLGKALAYAQSLPPKAGQPKRQ